MTSNQMIIADSEAYRGCTLCPRACGADRTAGGIGACGVSDTLRVARAAPHFWEEPCLSGVHGSGAVFFSGCSLRCVYCQNTGIAHGQGKDITPQRLYDILFELKAAGVHNINLVTATHYTPTIAAVLRQARADGLALPVIWNSSGYERVETLRMLRGLVDIYLPDFKYADSALAARYSNAPDYPEIARAAIAEMVDQVGEPTFDSDGMMQQGVIVRHLLLPHAGKNARAVTRYLLSAYGTRIYISYMRQYTPMPGIGEHFPALGERVTDDAYRAWIADAEAHGAEHGFTQEKESAAESFIPPFDQSGVSELSSETSRKKTSFFCKKDRRFSKYRML